jgi:hypothetical protein
MSQDEDHLRLLSVFHYVVGGLLAFCACMPLIHLGLGFVLLFAPQALGPARDQPPPIIGWLLVGFAGAFILAGWTTATPSSLHVLFGRGGRRLPVYAHCNHARDIHAHRAATPGGEIAVWPTRGCELKIKRNAMIQSVFHIWSF